MPVARFAIASILLVCVSVAEICRASELEVDGVLSLYPVGRTTALAVEIPLESGQALSGLRWYNNDGTLPFPKLLLMEAQAGLPPDLSQTGMILQEVVGESLAWGDVTLMQPVTSSSGRIFAVFLFPEGAEMTSEGAQGGPGIGYRRESGTAAYLSADGVEWVRLSPAHSLAIEPVLLSGKVEAPTLESLKKSVDPAALPRESPRPLPQRTRLVSAVPNPFNPRTEIRFELAKPEQVDLRVFNLRGQLVRLLHDNVLPAGEHREIWDGLDDQGKAIASGVYLVQLRAGSSLEQLRVTLVR